MQAASRHLTGDQNQVGVFCCVCAEQGAAGAAAALWQVVAAASANSLQLQQQQQKAGTDPAPALTVHAVTLLDVPEAVRRRHSELGNVDVHWAPYPASGRDVKGFASFVESQLSHATNHMLLAIDSLDAALVYHGTAAVLDALQRLKKHAQVAGIIAAVHASAQAPAVLAALRQLATCALLLRPVSALQAEAMQGAMGHRVHLEATALTLRHSGRVKVESELLELLPSGCLQPRRAPPDLAVTAQQLAAKQVAEAQAAAVATAEKKEQDGAQSRANRGTQSSFMKLSLSTKEKEAKDKVVMPWQHQGEQASFDADSFTSYLPPAAGGQGKGGGADGLGHILYVRDSDNDADSDEDPDDDLDI